MMNLLEKQRYLKAIDVDYQTDHPYVIISVHIWTDIFNIRIEKPPVVCPVLSF